MTLSHLVSVTLKNQCQGHSDFESSYLVKESSLGNLLLLNISRKPFIGSPVTPSHLTLNGIESSNPRPPRFRSIIPRKGVEYGHMLPLYINRKPCMGSRWCDHI